MDEPGSKPRGRMHDAEGAREAILNAGEEVFAEHGFDGARIDAIAEVSGYNKSLIFQYFDDKLGLYAAVIRRADEETRLVQNRALLELIGTEKAMSFERLQLLLREYVGWYFDYLIERPQIMRIYNWEMAEGWQTFSKILTERDYQDVEVFAPLFEKVQQEGLMRAEPSALFQFTTAIFSCHTFLAIIPMYKTLLPESNLQSPALLAQAREFIIDFIISGLLVKRKTKKQSQSMTKTAQTRSGRRQKGK